MRISRGRFRSRFPGLLSYGSSQPNILVHPVAHHAVHPVAHHAVVAPVVHHAPVVAHAVHAAPVVAPVVVKAAPAYAPAPVAYKPAPAYKAEEYPDEVSPYTFTYAVADDYSKANFNAEETSDGAS